jgi:hypothetical protein
MIARRMVAAGVVVAAVTAGGVAGALIGIPGLSSASSSSPSVSTAQPGYGNPVGPHVRRFFGPAVGADKGLLDAAAKALKLSTPDLLQKLSDGKTTIADIATQQKVDVHTVIAAMEAVAATDISNFVNNPLPTFPPFGGKGPLGGTGGSGLIGPGGPGNPIFGGLGFGLRGMLGGSIDAVAKALGISSTDLLGDLRNGQSIADIAKSKHVDLNTLINTLVTDAQTQIGAAVKAGDLPQAVATKLEANLKQLVTDAVNNASLHGFGRAAGFGGWGAKRPGVAAMPALPTPAS